MSRQLVESIISKNMIEANDMLEAKLAEIREKKLYEMKRQFAAEAFGAYSLAQIKADLASGKKVRASAPKEKGGLGLSPYDQMKANRKQKEGEKEKKVPLPDMKKERRIGEEALDEASAESVAQMRRSIKTVRSMSDAEKDQYKAAMKGGIGAALKLKKMVNARKKPEQEKPGLDSKLSKKREKLDKWIASGDRARSGGRNIDAAKAVGSGLAKGIGGLARELGDIGTSNLR